MLLAVLLATPSRALADPATDLPAIHALLPAGRDLAGAWASAYDATSQRQTITLRTGTDYATAVENSYVFADLDGDGDRDLAVATELPPTPPSAGSADGPGFGARTLSIFLADASGKLLGFAEAPHVVLGGAEGGVFGDPFAGLRISGTRTLTVEHYGGSNDRWSVTQKFQFRGGDFYLIGETRGNMNAADASGTTIDINLLTGEQIETVTYGQEAAGKADTITHRRLGKKALVRMVDATAE